MRIHKGSLLIWICVLGWKKSEEAALVDAFWDMGWLRYGDDDWRCMARVGTALPSWLEDLLKRTEEALAKPGR